LENKITELELENNSKSTKINELEQWIMCLSNSTLVAAGNQLDASTMKDQIQYVKSTI